MLFKRNKEQTTTIEFIGNTRKQCNLMILFQTIDNSSFESIRINIMASYKEENHVICNTEYTVYSMFYINVDVNYCFQ